MGFITFLPLINSWFIPAPAGNGKWKKQPAMFTTVHPRACGEWDFAGRSPALLPGSSPRLRGMVAVLFGKFRMFRFIPAPAGNGPAILEAAILESVHPRACGEWFTSSSFPVLLFGSSPRLRGMVCTPGYIFEPLRFIPAPAGNGHTSADESGSVAVHPRACGEWARGSETKPLSHGSSPRLRGMVLNVDHKWICIRFIPAPAGNGPQGLPRSSGRTVHPRACGEWDLYCHRRNAKHGSSPRLRGMGKPGGL